MSAKKYSRNSSIRGYYLDQTGFVKRIVYFIPDKYDNDFLIILQPRLDPDDRHGSFDEMSKRSLLIYLFSLSLSLSLCHSVRVCVCVCVCVSESLIYASMNTKSE